VQNEPACRQGVDPDLTVPKQQPLSRVLVVIALGGALGASARYGVGSAWPTGGGFPWSTFAVNVLGCLLLGALLVGLTELRGGHPLLRPFLGTGVLGGFTTFSTYAVDGVTRDAAGLAAGYVAATLGAALLATWVGVTLTRRIGLR